MPRLVPSNALPAGLRAVADDEYGRPAEPRWTAVDWSQHVHDVVVQGRRVRYAEIGDPAAPPVVLVHGIAGCWQNWLEQLPRLAAEGYRAIAPDLPGFGASEMPAGEISISAFGRTLDAFCGTLGLGPVPLVGHSMGGFIAAETAIAYPARVERLVLVAAAGITHNDLVRAPTLVAGRVMTAVTARQLVRLDAVVRRPRLRHAVLAFLWRHPRRMRPELIAETVAGAGTPGFMGAMESVLGYDLRERLPEIACPTLVVWGTEDMLCPVRDCDEFARLIPNARKVVLSDTGHMLQQERAEAFNRELLAFLAERPAQAASKRELSRAS